MQLATVAHVAVFLKFMIWGYGIWYIFSFYFPAITRIRRNG